MTKKKNRKVTTVLQLEFALRKLLEQHRTEEVLRQLANAIKAEDFEANDLW